MANINDAKRHIRSMQLVFHTNNFHSVIYHAVQLSNAIFDWPQPYYKLYKSNRQVQIVNTAMSLNLKHKTGISHERRQQREFPTHNTNLYRPFCEVSFVIGFTGKVIVLCKSHICTASKRFNCGANWYNLHRTLDQ